MHSLHLVLALAHQIAGLLLTLYACFLFSAAIFYILFRQRHDWPLAGLDPDLSHFPPVTVQIPIYNEPLVARRVVEAVADLDYPAERLQIQILDDSTDRTSALLPGLVARLRRERNLNITYHHRRDRRGYKAGALAAALPQATGEFIAIFDADYLPPRSWLRRTLPALLAHPHLAFVQTRWGHLNRSQNLITAAQGLAMDGHFVIEQQARSAAGLLQNFNGSGGLWRRVAIDAAGGWTADTVTEDLDLSYRAQLQGWRGAYLNSIEAPAELPPNLSSYKRQQRRWAKGSAQTLRKLAPHLWRSHLPLWRRVYAILHLSGYATHLPLLTLLALTLPLALLPDRPFPLPLPGAATLAISLLPMLLYALAQQQLDGWAALRRLWALPALALLSLGLSPSLAAAVLSGWRQRGGVFDRTPKQGTETGGPALPEDVRWSELAPEAITLLVAATTALTTAAHQRWALLPLPLLFSLGCGWVLLQGASEYFRAAMRTPGPRATTLQTQTDAPELT